MFQKFEKVQCIEDLASVPYIGLVLPKVPFYRFIGRVPAVEEDEDDAPSAGLKLPTLATAPPSVAGPKVSVNVPEFKAPRFERVGSKLS